MCKLKEGLFSNGKDYYKKEFNNTDSETTRILKCKDCGKNYIEVIYKEDVIGYRYTDRQYYYTCDCELLNEYKDFSKRELLYIIKDYEQQMENKNNEIKSLKDTIKRYKKVIVELTFTIKTLFEKDE